MTRDQLIARFNLKQLVWQDNCLNKGLSLRPSAVLIPLVERNGTVNVLLTKRSANLRHHPSQISFPGGKYEQTDQSLRMTAIPETNEELGIAIEKIAIFGQLPSHQTITGFHVTPYIGFIDQDYQAIVDPGEVAELFEIPLNQLLTNSDHFSLMICRKKVMHQVYFKPTSGKAIWGITAAILEQLKRLLH